MFEDEIEKTKIEILKAIRRLAKITEEPSDTTLMSNALLIVSGDNAKSTANLDKIKEVLG